MDVYAAVTGRRAFRGYTTRPVPREIIERVLGAAAWAPSGSNLQPWQVFVVTGGPLAELTKRVLEREAAGDLGDERQFAELPDELVPPYRERRSDCGRKIYGARGIARDDQEGRRRAVSRNWSFFGAPAGLFCYIDRSLGQAQWADLGMYLQSVMLLLRAEGLDSCPQIAWARYRTTVSELVGAPEELILYCGMSIGYADEDAPYLRPERAPLSETVTFLGD
ncbi:nitroreductase [Pseudonocardiaceae bacterium YIM PH 21723]|nr:nitroreductase [Pseudonocardiaceae bacterium YIM PH 21723]